MTVSVFRAVRTVTIDGVSPTVNDNDLFRCGQLISMGSKTVNRRCIHTFDLPAAPAEGPPLPVNAQVTVAEFLGNVTLIIGAADETFTIERLAGDHADYAYLVANWTLKDTGEPWRAPGADIETTPPGFTYNMPSSTGDRVITGDLAGYVRDALVERGGLLMLRHRLTVAVAADSAHFTVKAAPPGDADITRLRVTWSGSAPARIDRPAAQQLPGSVPGRPARAAPAHAPAGAAQPARTRRPRVTSHQRQRD